MEQKAPWWVYPTIVLVFAAAAWQLVDPASKIGGFLFIVALAIVVIWLVSKIGWAVAVILGVLLVGILVYAAIDFGLTAISTWGFNWGNTWATPRPLGGEEVWVFQTLGIPQALYLFLIAAGLVTTWMIDAGGIKASLITLAASILGALILGQIEILGMGAVAGVVGSIIAIALGAIAQPKTGEPLLRLAFGSILFGGIYFFIGPVLAWISLMFGMIAPNLAVTFIAGWLAGAAIVAAVVKSLE